MTSVPEPDDRLSAYLDDELDPTERAEVERYLEQSEAWRGALDEVAWARDAVRGLPVREAPRRVRRPLGGRARRVLGVAAAAAAAVAVFSVPLDRPEEGGGGRRAANRPDRTAVAGHRTGDTTADDDRNVLEKVVDALVEPFDW